MKKIFTLIIIIINIAGIIIGLGSNSTEARIINDSLEKDRLEMIKEKGVITVAAPPMESPFFYVNPETKKTSGIDADILNEIARRLGINKVEIKEIPFPNLLENFSTDDSIDLSLGGIFITPENEKLVNFTEPLYKESEVVIVPKLSKINFMSDLKDSVIGVEEGTIFKDLAESWKRNNFVKDVSFYGNTIELINDLNKGEIDAVLADSVIMNYKLLNEKNLKLRILQGYTPQLQVGMGIAVKNNDISLLNEVNKTINDMKSDGTLYAILVGNGLDKSNMV